MWNVDIVKRRKTKARQISFYRFRELHCVFDDVMRGKVFEYL
ncbi:unnamed protein product [Arabidopsis halleri]